MEQPFLGQTSNDLSSTSTEYNSVLSARAWVGAENMALSEIPCDGIIKELNIKLQNAPGDGNSYYFALMVNGVASDLYCTISGTDTTGSDISSEIDVGPGDGVSLKVVPSSGPTTGNCSWSMVFEGDNASESVILGRNITPTNAQGTLYAQPNGFHQGPLTSEVDAYVVCPTSGDIDNLYVEIKVYGDYTFDITLRKDGVDTALTLNCEAGSAANDTVNSVAVSAGEILTLSIENVTGNPVGNHYFGFGMRFTADTDGESLILSNSNSYARAGGITYYSVLQCGDYSGLAPDESTRKGITSTALTLKKFYVVLQTSPGADKTFRYNTRINGADGNLTIDIDDAETTGNDTVHTDSVSALDELTFREFPINSPTTGDICWGIVCYIAPSGGEPQPDPEPEVTYRLRPLD